MRRLRSAGLWGYALAVVACASAVGLKYVLGPHLVPGVFVPFFLAVLVATWYGGFGSGLLTTALSACAAAYFFLPTLQPGADRLSFEITRTGLFVILGTVSSWIVATLQNTRRTLAQRITARTAELSGINTRLEAQLAEQRRTEQLLRKSEERYAVAVDGANDGLLDWDLETNSIYASPRCLRILDFEDVDSTRYYDEWLERLHPDDRDRVLGEMDAHLAGRTPHYEIEYRVRLRDGSYRWVLARALMVRDRSGKPCRVAGSVTDISKRKEAEEVMRETEERFQNAFQFASIGMALVGLDGMPLQVNRALADMLGYSTAELLTKPVQEVTHPDDLTNATHDRDRLVAGVVDSYRAERRYLHKQGHTVWAYLSISVIRDNDGHPLYLVSQLQDITQRKAAEAALRRAHAELETRVEQRTAELREANQRLTVEIAERRLTEDALRQSEERFRAIFDQAGIGVALAGINGRWLLVNPKLCEILGYTREELLDRTFADVTHPEDLASSLERFHEMQNGERSGYTIEKRYLRKDGRVLWAQLTASTAFDQNGQPQYGIALIEDTTARKEAEAALHETTTRLQLVMDQLPTMLWTTDLELRFTSGVAKQNTYLKISSDEAKGRNVGELLGSADPDLPTIAAHRRALLGETVDYETTWQERTFGCHVEPLRDRAGTIIGTIGIGEDITERRHAERALWDTTHALQAVIRASPLAIVSLDAASRVQMWSPGAEAIFGWSEAEVRGVPIPFIPGEKREEFQALFERSLQGETHADLELRRTTKNGTLIDVNLWSAPLHDTAGNVTGVMAILADVTDRKRAEERLREAEVRYRTLVEQLPAITYVAALDEIGSTLYISPQLEVTLGFSPRECMAAPALCARQIHPQDRERVLTGRARSRATGEPFSSEYRMHARDGRVLWFRDESVVIRNDGGGFLYAQGVLVDITERKRAEERLQELSQRLLDILESMTDGFIALDHAGRFTYVNPTAEQRFVRPRTDVIGKTLAEVFPHATESAFYQQYKNVLTQRVPSVSEVYSRDLQRWFKVRAYPSQEGVAMLFEDISERHSREMTAVSDILHGLNAHLTLTDAFPAVAAGLRSITGCDRSSLALFDESATWITLVILDDSAGPMNQHVRVRVAECPGAPDLLAGHAHIVHDLAAELDSPMARIEYDSGFRSLLSLPLKGRQSVFGMLNVSWRQTNGLTLAQLPLLSQIADAVALAVEKASLFEQVHASRERLQALSHRLLEVQENERRRIARELHDEIGQTLTGLKLIMGSVDRLSTDAARGPVRELHNLVDDLLARVRNLSLDLRPGMLDDLGLLPTLVWLFGRYSSQSQIHVAFEHSGMDRRFDPDVETAAYRIIQEALTNVARHASVTEVTVRAWVDNGALNVQVNDQGPGFDADTVLANGSTSGLAGMRERTLLLGGRLTLESSPGGGTRLSAEFPVHDSAEGNWDEHHDRAG